MTTHLQLALEHVETHRDRGLRQSLERQRDEILRGMRERIRYATEAASDGPIPEPSSASDIVDDMDLVLVSLQTETLEKIDDALDRLARGEYGYCADCGEEIPPRRLEALPFAVRCRDCEAGEEERRAVAPVALTAHRPAFLG